MKRVELEKASLYLPLGFAAVCLCLAESAIFIPWLKYCLPGIFVILALAWYCEGRWGLSESAANYIGVFISGALIFWIVLQMPKDHNEAAANSAPWPASLLPHLGPLMLILLLVKVFRPKKMPDFWAMQTIGLMMVTLGCILASEIQFGLFLLTYLVSLIWALMIYHYCREDALLGRAGFADQALFRPTTATVAEVPWRRLGIPQAAGWLAMILALTVPLFYLMPRATDHQWLPEQLTQNTAAEPKLVDHSDDQMDLNRTGKVQLSNSDAFLVEVTNEQGEATNLPDDMYWRAEVLDSYGSGRWTLSKDWNPWGRRYDVRRAALPPTQREVRLRYEFRPAVLGDLLVLAEPMYSGSYGNNRSIEGRYADVPFFQNVTGADLVKPRVINPRQLYRYEQRLKLSGYPTAFPAAVTKEYATFLTARYPETLSPWTRGVLQQLSGLSDDDRHLDENGQLSPQSHAKVARALCAYLASSGRYRYTLELRRENPDADPTVDFLMHVKEGHCERFASGLALMLRSVGIPARVIKGYRGAEKAEDGKYLVKLNQAHSWVQALVRNEENQYVWLQLEPTPGGADLDSSTPILLWLLHSLRDGETLWRDFVTEYNSDLQFNLLRKVGVLLVNTWQNYGPHGLTIGLPVLLVLAGATSLSRWRKEIWASAQARQSTPGFYRQFLALANQHWRLAPTPAQTPLEFATAVAQTSQSPEAGELAHDIATAINHMRYGGVEPDAQTSEQFHQRLEALAKTLAARAR